MNMKKWSTILLRSLAVAVPVVLGGLGIIFSDRLKSAPETQDKQRQPTLVRVITLAPVDLVPRVKGYGTVTPAREWRAVARVEGEIAETSPLLARGQIALAGTVLLRIDDTDLRLSIAQIDAQLGALGVKDQTLQSSLAITRADLEFSQVELKRQDDLYKRGIVSQTVRDQAARQELAARAKVTDMENQLALNAAERSVLSAQRASSVRNLDFTDVTAPFDVRIGAIQADLGQFVPRGSTLFAADGIDAAEITAQFAIGDLGPVVRTLEAGGTVMNLAATVRMLWPGHTVEWDAKIARVGDAIDARTQSSPIVVRVDRPQEQVQAGVRPPLRRDMFLEVELRAPPVKVLAVPSASVHDGRVLVVDGDGKLASREVTVPYRVENLSIIGAGLTAGDRLVVSDLSIAVLGMNVKPIEDKALAAEVAAVAIGAEAPK